MNPSIPASEFVNVIPSVLGTGGNPLSLNAVFLTTDGSIPIGVPQGFGNLLAVQNWFGPNAIESQLAAVYFAGFNGCTSLPGVLYFAQYNSAAVSAYIRSGSMAGVTLTQLKTLSGVLVITINGSVVTSATINLSGATSFANAAALITTGLGTAVCTYDALRQAFVITSSTTGALSTIGFATGTLSAGLLLTQATGATLSQGAAIATPAGAMNAVIATLQNFATFMTVFQPIESVMEAFAAWVNGTNQRYMYVNWDSNVLAVATPPQSTVFGTITAADNGVVSVYDSTGTIAAFVCAIVASIDFSAINGYTNFAGKGSALLTPNVIDLTSYLNLVANGYNCYAAIATANQNFQWFEPGQISGAWNWIDEYAFQIWLNAALQLAGMSLINNTKSIPFNTQGASLIYAAYRGPITQGITFGGIQAGITLSDAQIAEVNAAAGVAIDATLYHKGWYLQVSIPNSTVQGTRGPWPAVLWYCNAGGVNTLRLASINIQ